MQIVPDIDDKVPAKVGNEKASSKSTESAFEKALRILKVISSCFILISTI